MRIRTVVMISVLSAVVLSSTLFGRTFASWAVTDNAKEKDIRITIGGAAKSIKFYTSFDGTNWGGIGQESVYAGDHLDSIPSVSLDSGYTLKGWTETIPSTSNYTSEYSSSELLALEIENDMVLYPIIESNNDYAFADSNYYSLNSDVDLDVSSISSVKVGKRYVGINGIPNPSASIDAAQNIITASGKYQFHNDGKIFRKIGFNPNTSWRNLWDSTFPSFSFHTWGDYDYDYLRPNDAGGYIYYAYIPATNQYFMITRQYPGATSIDNDHNSHSGDMSLTSTNYGSGTAYSKTNIVLGQYDDVGYNSGWNEYNAWWF